MNHETEPNLKPFILFLFCTSIRSSLAQRFSEKLVRLDTQSLRGW
jgi:hypothetical protein